MTALTHLDNTLHIMVSPSSSPVLAQKLPEMSATVFPLPELCSSNRERDFYSKIRKVTLQATLQNQDTRSGMSI